MNPVQVLEMQADFVARFDRHKFHAYVAGCLSSEYESRAKDPRRLGEEMALGLRQHVMRADAYRVTEDMSMLVQFAASKLEVDDKIDRTLPPSPWGFVRFDRPLPITEVRGRTMLAHWMTWGPATQPSVFDAEGAPPRAMTFVSFWNDPGTQPDDVWMENEKHEAGGHAFSQETIRSWNAMKPEIGRWAFIGGEVMRDGDSLGPPEVALGALQMGLLRAEGVEAPVPHTNCRRYAHALWLLLNQTVTVVQKEGLPRNARNRIGRMPIPGRVSVIMLRRAEGARAAGESMVEWSHRWLVKGHWRWQACGEGRKDRVRIWINGYVKGPADKPFVVTDKVYSLSR